MSSSRSFLRRSGICRCSNLGRQMRDETTTYSNSRANLVMATDTETAANGPLSKIFLDIVYSPINLILLAICVLFLYKIYVKRRQPPVMEPTEPELPRMKKQDLTLEQLKQYNGDEPHKRVLVAVNGKVFDVTKGRRFYGPGKFSKIAYISSN